MGAGASRPGSCMSALDVVNIDDIRAAARGYQKWDYVRTGATEAEAEAMLLGHGQNGQQDDSKSLLSRLGGTGALKWIFNEFYKRLMIDPQVSGFFEHVNMSPQNGMPFRQTQFMCHMFSASEPLGCPYHGRDIHVYMRGIHIPLIKRGMRERHYDIAIVHLKDSLVMSGVNPAAIQEALEAVESVRPTIFKPAPGEEPDEELAVIEAEAAEERARELAAMRRAVGMAPAASGDEDEAGQATVKAVAGAILRGLSSINSFKRQATKDALAAGTQQQPAVGLAEAAVPRSRPGSGCPFQQFAADAALLAPHPLPLAQPPATGTTAIAAATAASRPHSPCSGKISPLAQATQELPGTGDVAAGSRYTRERTEGISSVSGAMPGAAAPAAALLGLFPVAVAGHHLATPTEEAGDDAFRKQPTGGSIFETARALGVSDELYRTQPTGGSIFETARELGVAEHAADPPLTATDPAAAVAGTAA